MFYHLMDWGLFYVNYVPLRFVTGALSQKDLLKNSLIIRQR